MPDSEKKICQNCHKDFIIEPEDFKFYQKISVPPPTWCPECRMVRRMNFRNERTLYNRKCDLCKKEIISMYDKNHIAPVYCYDCWHSDKWNPMDYGNEYDLKITFFEQIKNLVQKVPCLALEGQKNSRVKFLQNSYECLDSYFLYDCVNCQNCFMSSNLRHQKYVFRNKKLAKEEYEQKMREIDFGSYEQIVDLIKEYESAKLSSVRKFARNFQSL